MSGLPVTPLTQAQRLSLQDAVNKHTVDGNYSAAYSALKSMLPADRYNTQAWIDVAMATNGNDHGFIDTSLRNITKDMITGNGKDYSDSKYQDALFKKTYDVKNTLKKVLVLTCSCMIYGCYYPSLKVDVSGLKKGEISKIIEEDWMNSTDDVTKKIRKSFLSYMDKNKCIDLKCYEGFGFNDCRIESKIKCNYQGVIIITNDERVKTIKNEKIYISVDFISDLDKKNFSIYFVRTGSNFVFQ